MWLNCFMMYKIVRFEKFCSLLLSGPSLNSLVSNDVFRRGGTVGT